jgi:hypothetical protein
MRRKDQRSVSLESYFLTVSFFANKTKVNTETTCGERYRRDQSPTGFPTNAVQVSKTKGAAPGSIASGELSISCAGGALGGTDASLLGLVGESDQRPA